VLTTSDANPRDVAAMADLFLEMDRFYGEDVTEPTDPKIRQITSVLFGDRPLAYAVLAWDGQSLIGMAAYSFLWPAARTTKSLYLKELYVRQSHRRRGVGKLLMERIFNLAKDNDCSRVEWTTDEGNLEAQRFYEKIGVPANPSKIFYRVEGPDLFTIASHTNCI
jgi:GNAT superfamily N-acetyltransferase